MIHDAAIESSLSNGELASSRLLVVVAEGCSPAEVGIVRVLRGQPGLDLKVAAVHCPSVPTPISLGERLYRALDRRLFGGRPTAGPVDIGSSFEEGDLPSIAARCKPHAIVDLTGTVGETTAWLDIPVIGLQFDRTPARNLERAVRQRLGSPGGTVRVRATARSARGSGLLFSAACFIDHRSFVRSVDLVIRKIPMILEASLRRRSLPQEFHEEADSDVPSSALGAARMLCRLGASIGRRLLWRDQWRILVYRDQTRQRLGPPWVSLCPDGTAFWADPFVVPHSAGATIFFEELPFASGKGRISVIDIDHEGHASVPVVVLDKPWHLSYPFVFEWDGRRYMIPESSANETVDLYECMQFPRHWRHIKTLIAGRRFADVSVIHWRGRLWMFAAHGQPGASNYDELHVFWADDLLGPWHPHALNPVKIDAGTARPAGAMFVDEGRLVRPTQDCRDRYGDGVAFQEVLVLDECRFLERPLGRLAPGGVAPGEAFHTYNEAGRFVVIDAARTARRW